MLRIKQKVLRLKETGVEYTVTEDKITNPNAVVQIAKDIYEMDQLTEEVFVIITLNTKSKIISVHEVSKGSLNASIVHPREVFKRALLDNAASIICIHNHPSGDTKPSKNDKDITDRLISAGEILGVEVVDHIIIGDNQHFSFRENDLIWTK